jgi:Na+-translocating ferredoxin:NAD+ oxidoreductase RnfE subunit
MTQAATATIGMRDSLISLDSASLLGLYPLMVITTSMVNGLALGIAATLVLTLTMVGISAGVADRVRRCTCRRSCSSAPRW